MGRLCDGNPLRSRKCPTDGNNVGQHKKPGTLWTSSWQVVHTCIVCVRVVFFLCRRAMIIFLSTIWQGRLNPTTISGCGCVKLWWGQVKSPKKQNDMHWCGHRVNHATGQELETIYAGLVATECFRNRNYRDHMLERRDRTETIKWPNRNQDIRDIMRFLQENWIATIRKVLL